MPSCVRDGRRGGQYWGFGRVVFSRIIVQHDFSPGYQSLTLSVLLNVIVLVMLIVSRKENWECKCKETKRGECMKSTPRYGRGREETERQPKQQRKAKQQVKHVAWFKY